MPRFRLRSIEAIQITDEMLDNVCRRPDGFDSHMMWNKNWRRVEIVEGEDVVYGFVGDWISKLPDGGHKIHHGNSLLDEYEQVED